jgi:DNA-binding MarR family transcriptional regulator
MEPVVSARAPTRQARVRATPVTGRAIAKVAPLSPSEEELWRALMRIVKTLPRHLDNDLVRSVGLTASEYTTIMHLSEAPKRELRMADLAEATGLSASRTTRLVDDLVSRSLVTKRGSSADGRSNIAKLTPQGMTKLKAAWPAHLASVRKRMFDHIDASAVQRTAQVLSVVAAQLEE